MSKVKLAAILLRPISIISMCALCRINGEK